MSCVQTPSVVAFRKSLHQLRLALLELMNLARDVVADFLQAFAVLLGLRDLPLEGLHEFVGTQ